MLADRERARARARDTERGTIRLAKTGLNWAFNRAWREGEGGEGTMINRGRAGA